MVADRYVIVGAGLAGAKTAEALREQGFDSEIVLLGREQHLPYERPPLSKEYLQGQSGRDGLFVHDPDWYAAHEIELRTSTTVSGIDRDEHRIRLADGQQLDYGKLLLATGSSPRKLSLSGEELAGVHYLRTLDDSDKLRDVLAHSSHLVIVGAGWIGLEAAAAARAAGLAVTVLEAAEQPLSHVLGEEIAPVFTKLHRDHGVDLRLGANVAGIVGAAGRVSGVRLGDENVVDADAVLIAAGAVPNAELAAAAGLAVSDGVLVDAALRTDDPDVYAVGDIARMQHPLLGSRLRVEHWANALNQPATAAAAMLGRAASFEALPYFFTDQYDLGMEYVGSLEPHGYDRVVTRGDTEAREFIACWLREGRVVAAMNVNIWDVTDPLKALIRDGTVVDTTRLADQRVSLTEVASTA